jgi:hypothetical protein
MNGSNDNPSGRMNSNDMDVVSGQSVPEAVKHTGAPAPVTLPREERNGEDNMD